MMHLIKSTNTQASDGAQDAESGYIQNMASATVTYTVVPFGQHYKAPLVTTSAPNQINGVKGDVPKNSVATTYTGLNATTVTGDGSDAVFDAVYADVSGTIQLTTITCTTAGSDYLVRDRLRITTPGADIAKDKRVASFTSIGTVSGADGRDVELTITPTSSRATATVPKMKVKVETDGTITDDAAYKVLSLGEGFLAGDTLTLDADNNDEGNTYTDGWTFTITLAADDLTNDRVIDFDLQPGANKATTTIILTANASTHFPIEEYTVTGTTDRRVAVYADRFPK